MTRFDTPFLPLGLCGEGPSGRCNRDCSVITSTKAKSLDLFPLRHLPIPPAAQGFVVGLSQRSYSARPRAGTYPHINRSTFPRRGAAQQQTRTMSRYRRLFPTAQLLLHPPPSSQRHLLPLLISTADLGPSTGRNDFSTTPQARSNNFDTLKVAQRLEANGFTSEQSKAVMQLLKDVIDESVMGLTRTMVTREEQDKVPLPKPGQSPFGWRILMGRRSINKKSTLRS